jgi:predicted RNA-binding Zn-ribbon protein involved in translation (DUF1610 family)
MNDDYLPVLEDNGDVTCPDDVSEPTRCLNCRSTIPAGADTCPQCGWTYKPEG